MVFGQYILTIFNSKTVEVEEACNEEVPEAEASVHKTSFIN